MESVAATTERYNGQMRTTCDINATDTVDLNNLIDLCPMLEAEKQRFSSWKEIAKFLNCCEKTARRWEIQRQLPVRRVPGGIKSSVYAFREDLEKWLEGNQIEDSVVSSPPPPTHTDTHHHAQLGSKQNRLLPVLTIAVILIVSAAFSLSVNRTRPLKLSDDGPDRLNLSNAAKLPPLAADGHYLYFQQLEHSRFRIIRKALDNTSQSEPIGTSIENPDPGAIAPDGSSFLLRNIEGSKDDDQPLFLQPLPAGPARRLGDILAYDSAWTPDQKHIIFSRSQTVYEATPDGAVTRKLFDTPGRAYWFRWAPDGKSLRFTVYDSNRSIYGIWETVSLNSAPYPSTFGHDTLTQQCCGAWSADGAFYFFQASVNGFFHVFAHRENSNLLSWGNRAAIQLTSGRINYRSPLPLPGGGRLLILSQSQKSEVVQYDGSTGQWLPLLEGISIATASYSPDSKWLAYTRSPDHTLWRCKMPGCTEPIQLTFPPLRVSMPRWSPDGLSIACMAREIGNPWRARIVPSNGGTLTPLLGAEQAEADPTWSPAGDRIAFGSVPNPKSGADAFIRILEIHSRKIHRVPGSEGLNTPSWSPDGRFLACVRSGTLDLAIFEHRTGKWRQVPGARAGYLNWSADGTRLFFLSLVERDQPRILAIEMATMKVLPIANMSEIRRPSFAFGDWIGLGLKDKPLALRDTGSEEIISWRFDNQ